MEAWAVTNQSTESYIQEQRRLINTNDQDVYFLCTSIINQNLYYTKFKESQEQCNCTTTSLGFTHTPQPLWVAEETDDAMQNSKF